MLHAHNWHIFRNIKHNSKQQGLFQHCASQLRFQKKGVCLLFLGLQALVREVSHPSTVEAFNVVVLLGVFGGRLVGISDASALSLVVPTLVVLSLPLSFSLFFLFRFFPVSFFLCLSCPFPSVFVLPFSFSLAFVQRRTGVISLASRRD